MWHEVVVALELVEEVKGIKLLFLFSSKEWNPHERGGLGATACFGWGESKRSCSILFGVGAGWEEVAGLLCCS